MAKKMQKTQTRSRSKRSKGAVRNGVTKTQLSNGLSVILKESHNAPVVTFWCWYRVGSRMERSGITGISHWVEHMLFKGTPTFPKSKVDRAVAREGGVFNGFTWLDFTTYFETLPAGKWELAAHIEADRMVNALFAPKEVEAERTVVISERQGNENNPQFLLAEEVQAAAFRVHPYHHEVIGNLCDLLTMTRDDLYTHYRSYYVPSNAVVVAVGDFKTADALKVIEGYFGRIEPGASAVPSVKEPPQRGERRVQVEGPGSTAYVSVVYQALPGAHPDFPAMVVLDAILGGASSLALFGGGGSNASSRLYRAMVDTELAADVSANLSPTVDPFLYEIGVTVRAGRAPAEAQAALDAELERIVQQPVTEAEIAKAIKQAKAMFAYGAESVTNQGFWYGFSEIFADHAWFESYLERLAAVSVDDVQRVARTYLTPQRRTVGWYVPTTNSESRIANSK
ncbi:MAG: insulinase family protein [Thermoflexales bacterium]|nr:insulinase family protein [Thermoflexales bacterium]